MTDSACDLMPPEPKGGARLPIRSILRGAARAIVCLGGAALILFTLYGLLGPDPATPPDLF